MHSKTLALSLSVAASLTLVGPAFADAPKVKVFLLAGQSNMQGQAVVDLDGRDYNGGRGTLKARLDDPAFANRFGHLRNDDGSWRSRDDVFVRYVPDGPDDDRVLVGPLSVGFTPYGGKHHFGPELQLGHVLGDAFEEPVLLVKTAWGGKSLFEDFRPPSAGSPGRFYTQMIAEVKTALASVGTEIPALAGRELEIAGFIWYHGWNDGCDPERGVAHYEENLVHLIGDVRRDLGAPALPAVIGEITGPWVEAPGEWGDLRRAQRRAAERPAWQGRVLFVPTAAFVPVAAESPNPTHGHHEFGNAETIVEVGDALGRAMRALALPGSPPFLPTVPAKDGDGAARVEGEMSGYMLVPVDRAPERFNAGFSLYAAAWPVVERYPGSRFQTGLFGTWMFAQYEEGAKPKDVYSDIEGGLGWWRDTRFPTVTPKFIMGGVALNFSAWANGPGAGKGRDWDRPLGKYAVAQLSPWVLWPPDGLNLAQGTCGELFGYGYLPLPLVNAKSTTAGEPVPTGDQCWTLFLNTENFKGPLCFFTPFFWSEASIERRDLAGLMLDTRPSDPNKAFQMETQWIPALLGESIAEGGERHRIARVAPTSFPLDKDGRTVVLHRLSVYAPEALTEPVRRWFAGGPAASGAIAAEETFVKRFGRGGGSSWAIFRDGAKEPNRHDIDWSAFGSPVAHDEHTFGYRWNEEVVRTVPAVDGGAGDDGARVARLPEYFRLERRDGEDPRWRAMPAERMPSAVRWSTDSFANEPDRSEGAYVTPEGDASPFRTPGPVAGPFQVTLGDGSLVTYAWYRFADQPAMLNADLTQAEREEAQRRVELLHRAWTKDRQYIAPPTTGELASLDPALLVTPPVGFEIGFVPIVLRQELKRE
jgi:hypothetical protein